MGVNADEGSLWVSIAALAVSVLSYYFAVRSWRESYRPLVTARVGTHSFGNMGAALNLIVENTGTRPARNVRLTVEEPKLASAFDPQIEDSEREQIRACFAAKFTIPVLANQASVSNAFGFLSRDKDNTWQWHSRIPIRIAYEDLDGRQFKHKLDLFVANNAGLASGAWVEKNRQGSGPAS